MRLRLPPPREAYPPHSQLASSTHPETAEVSIGGVIGLVVGVQQDSDDALLLFRQPGPQTVPEGLFFLPLQDHLPLPLHLLIRQDDCGEHGRRGSWQEEEGHPAHSTQ